MTYKRGLPNATSKNTQQDSAPIAAIQFGIVAREISDEEHKELLAQRRLTAKEWNAKSNGEQNAIRATEGRKGAAATKDRMLKLGIKKFKWRYSGGRYECKECQKRDGKTYYFSRLPAAGFPGSASCCPEGVCNCSASPVIPGFDT
jgi:hypothetical protein